MRHLCGIVIVLQMTILSRCSAQENATAPEEPTPNFECFYEPAESCPETGCKFLSPDNDTALCCNMSTFEFKEKMMVLQKNLSLTRLHVRNVTIEELNMGIFLLPNLESIAVTDGKVERVVRPNVTNLTNLQCLNLANNNIKEVDNRLIEDFPKLETLDLSFNNLTNFSIIPPANSKVLHMFLDISNNTRLWCNNITDLTAYMRNISFNLHILNRNNTMCIIFHRGNSWLEFYDSVPFHQVEKFGQMQQFCLMRTRCTCMLHRAIYIGDKYMYTTISVNCTGKNLTSLPEVPEHTVALIIADNNITNLRRIKTDPNYSDLTELHAQNNQISSLEDIEGSKFIRQFLFIDIRDNKLNEIQTYIFNSAFDNTRLGVIRVKLAGNKIKCDCNTAREIKTWLLKHTSIIDDYEDISCENFNLNIISLDQGKVCKYPRVWTDYINYIIAGEVIMLFLLISKVSYDYWVFRTAGYLPWPASKMPKMPCDWVFET